MGRRRISLIQPRKLHPNRPQSFSDGNGDSNGSPLWTMQHDRRWISWWRWLRCQLPTRAYRLAGKLAAGGAAVISSSARGAGGREVVSWQREAEAGFMGFPGKRGK